MVTESEAVHGALLVIWASLAGAIVWALPGGLDFFGGFTACLVTRVVADLVIVKQRQSRDRNREQK